MLISSSSRNYFLIFVSLILISIVSLSVNAQTQRSIVNPSFEQQFTGSRAASLNTFFNNSDWISIDRGEINGWETDHPSVTNGCPAGGGTYGASYTCNPIELWANSFLGVTPMQGIILAELNAYQSSKLYQNICMVNGEQFTFTFGHRGRSGVDTARFEVGNTNILTVSTGNSGTIGTINSGAATGTSRALSGTWTRYGGTYIFTGTSGVQQLGFEAVSSVGGSGVGNLLDDININLKPFVEFSTVSGSNAEAAAITSPKLKIVGTVPTGGLSMTLNVAGTATYNTDYNYTGTTTLTNISSTATTLTFTVPAGNYADILGNNLFALPLKIINDTVSESNETVIFTLPATSASNPFVLAGTTTCGASAQSIYTHTILDDDTDLQIIKSGTATANVGQTVTYSLQLKNNGPLAANSASFTDSVPANISGVTAICDVASGGAGTCSVNVSGNSVSGNIGVFPNGAIQTIKITGTAATAGNITNTAIISPPAGLEDPNCSGSPLVCTGNNTSSQATTINGQPNISLVKSCPLPANCASAAQLPNTDLTYKIIFTNTGGLAAMNLKIVDAIPANSDFKINSAAANTTASGLTIVIEYSNDYDPLNPNLATWTYTPVSLGGGASAGYDRLVKAIRWRVTAGTLSNISPANTGDVSFITKIR